MRKSQINRAKNVIPFLQDEDSKVLEFWQIWSESIPPKEDLQSGMSIEYHVSTSANMQKLTWRTGMQIFLRVLFNITTYQIFAYSNQFDFLLF